MRPASGAFCESCGGQIQWQNPASQLPVGSLLRSSTGRVYQVGAAKGQGGFGITYAAMDLGNWNRVAIKEYFPNRCATRDALSTVVPTASQLDSFQEGMRSFLKEGRMLSSVGALPSVVSVRDSFEANSTAYIVMEYVDGRPLHEVVKKRGRIPWNELQPMLVPLMRDLDILHRAGVIHRDISPDNLILTPENKLKLLDFGSARSVQGGDMTVMMKPGFSPVEQYQSRGQGPYTDVYALAGTIYFCLTGTIPPTSIERMTSDSLKSPNDYGAALSESQVKALLWGMNVQPNARPKTMRDFAGALFGDGAPVQTGAAATQTVNTGTDAKIPHSVRQEGAAAVVSAFSNTAVAAGATDFTAGKTGQVVTGSRGGSKKKPWGILGGVAAALAVAVLAVVLILGGSKTSGDFKYKVRDDKARVVAYTGSATTVNVPDKLDGYPVTAIGKGAFADSKLLTRVELPGTVDTVEKNAFQGCPKLQTVYFRESNTTVQVDDSAFGTCPDLLCLVGGSTGRTIAYDPGASGVAVCNLGKKLDQGVIKSVEIDGGIAYAITGYDCAVALNKSSSLPVFLDGRRVFDAQGDRVDVQSGVTSDGWKYEIYNGEAYIVGYQGTDSILPMPDDIDGVDIVMVCGGALAGNTKAEVVLPPLRATTIQAGAFDGCTNLKRVDLYSRTETVSPDAFTGCDKLRCLFVAESVVPHLSSLNLDGNCTILTFGLDTGDGELTGVAVTDDGAVYGITDNDDAVLMFVPASASYVEIPEQVLGENPVSWVYPGALDKASNNVTIRMCPNMIFPSELFSEANWAYTDITDISASWLLTCRICAGINAQRTTGPELVPDLATVFATQIRAPELAISYSSTRPSGDIQSLLDNCGVEWASAAHQRERFTAATAAELEEKLDELVDALVESFLEPYDDAGLRHYNKFGVSIYTNQYTDYYYVSAFGIVDD